MSCSCDNAYSATLAKMASSSTIDTLIIPAPTRLPSRTAHKHPMAGFHLAVSDEESKEISEREAGLFQEGCKGKSPPSPLPSPPGEGKCVASLFARCSSRGARLANQNAPPLLDRMEERER